MAPVIVDSARAARRESRRLRLASLELRESAHANSRTARAGREKATAHARDHGRLATWAPSPWSDLAWRRDDEELRRTLVPVD